MTTPLDIAEELAQAGFIVTVGHEIEAAAAAYLLGIKPKTLKNWRNTLKGPQWRVRRGLAWYPLADVIAWRSGPLRP